MTFKVVIPARYASERLPGKPLLELAGKPMIEHVWKRAVASGADDILIATDDERIASVGRSFGARVCMTSSEHRSGSDRIAEVATARQWQDDEIVVNLQGDEPLMPAANISQVAALLLKDSKADIATLCEPLADQADFLDPSTVKLVRDRAGRALYFSRAPIPAARAAGHQVLNVALRHLGLYAYRVGALQRLAAEPPCALETLERLEQLRALWLGMLIRVEPAVAAAGRGVDNAADAEAVARQLEDAGS